MGPIQESKVHKQDRLSPHSRHYDSYEFKRIAKHYNNRSEHRLRSKQSPGGKFRKEVIQPHLPVRLPCYDLAPVTGFTLDLNK